MKYSEFNVEDTHLTHLDRIERLFAVMIIAFTGTCLTGIHKHLFIVPECLSTGEKQKAYSDMTWKKLLTAC